MAIFRIVKTDNYTIMSDFHLRDKTLSLKAKGLQSVMLSLPDDWDFSENGLVKITGEGICSLRTALKQLEKHGYLVRKWIRNDNGTLKDMEYIIYETPHNEEISPLYENLKMDNPFEDNPISENHTQINTNNPNTDKRNTDSINPSTSDVSINGLARTPTQEEIYSTYEQIIRDNVDTELFEHEISMLNKRAEQDDLSNEEYDNEFNSINPETMNQVIRYMVSVIAGDSSSPIMIYDTPVPRAIVISKLLKIDHFKLRDCIRTLNTNQKIRNKRNYAISMLYNS